jgi:hypothetical protein
VRYSRLLAFILFASFYAMGNLGGNYAGWYVIFKWFEIANGEKAMDPLFTSPIVLLCLAILPSVGQWFREWFDIEDKWKWYIYVVMAADLGINTIGFYYLVMGEFAFPPVMSVFVFLSVLAFIPNVFCQSLATLNLKKLLAELEQQRAKGGKKPAMPPANVRPAMMQSKRGEQALARRTNGSIPLDIEELQL